jgi:hypothetical protein
MKIERMNGGIRQSHCVSVINIILNLVLPAVKMLSYDSILFGLSEKFSPLYIEPSICAQSERESVSIEVHKLSYFLASLLIA